MKVLLKKTILIAKRNEQKQLNTIKSKSKRWEIILTGIKSHYKVCYLEEPVTGAIMEHNGEARLI